MDKNKSLISWHINDTLDESEKSAVEDWLQNQHSAKGHYQAAQKYFKAVRSQEVMAPSIQVKTRLFERIQENPIRSNNSIHPWFWGGPIMLLTFILLLFVIQPSTKLHWTTSGNTPSAFRIYRAPAGTGHYQLIEELPATSTQQTYQYTDYLVIPGRNYQYIIEVRDQIGNTIFSQATMSDSLMTLASQIAILLTSFMLTFGMITLIEDIKHPLRLNLFR